MPLPEALLSDCATSRSMRYLCFFFFAPYAHLIRLLSRLRPMPFSGIFTHNSNCIFLAMCGKNVRVNRWFRQARTTLTTVSGKVSSKSARCWSPKPSRRPANRTMEQWALLNSEHTTASDSARCGGLHFFFLHVLLFCPRCRLLDVSRLLGLALLPSAPVGCCHRDSMTRWRLTFSKEAARVASSSSSRLFFWSTMCLVSSDCLRGVSLQEMWTYEVLFFW